MNKLKSIFSHLGKTGSYFLKGIVIGIAMIIPGVSGGTLAVILKIYDDMIEAINGIFKHFIKSMKVLIPILLGALVGFIALMYPIKLGLEHCPLIIVTLFVGLVIGSLPYLYKNVKGKEKPTNVIWGVITLALMIGLCFTGIRSYSKIDLNVGMWFYLLLIGFIISCALVTPGISGSMMLMTFGFYSVVIGCIQDLLKLQNVSYNISILVPLGIGILVGFFVISFIMGILLKKRPTETYFGIFGFIIGSIGTVYFLIFNDAQYHIVLDAFQISMSVICLLGGGAISYFISRIASKNEKKEDVPTNLEEENGH